MRVSARASTGFASTMLRVVAAMSIWALVCPEYSNAAESESYRRYLVAEGLNKPEAMVPLSSDTVLVAERSGRVLLLKDRERLDLGEVSVPGMHIFYVPERPFTEGLKDLVAVPGRPDTFLWCMTTGNAQDVRWTVGRGKIAWVRGQAPAMQNEFLWQSEPQPWTRSNPPPFSGCRMAVDGADVVVALGANDREKGSGRVIRVSMSGSHAPQVVSTGHRNPSGVVVRSGVLWEIEHGPKGGDELNIITQGGDYGWPAVSKGTPDDGNHQSGFLNSRVGFVDPVVTWTPAIAPSSITLWRGGLYVGALQGAAVLELMVEGEKIISQRRFMEVGKRVRDVRASFDGRALWVLTDGPDAELFQIVPGQLDPR